MRLDYLLPSETLRSQLTVYALASISGRRLETLPAMLPNIHIRLAGECSYRFGDGKWVAAPRVAVLGPTTASYQMELQPGLELLAVGLLPEGWASFVRATGVEFSDGVVDGELLWGRGVVESLCDALNCVAHGASRLRVIESFLLSRLRGAPEIRTAALAIDHWLEHCSDLSLDTLCDELDVTARHLRRLTLETHGMSPKTLAMKYRCLRAAASLAVRGEAGLDDALRAFADQAHLTRDFRRFVGWTPISFVRENQNVAAATFAGRLRIGATRPLALLS